MDTLSCLKYAKIWCCVFVDRWINAIEKNLLDEHEDMDSLLLVQLFKIWFVNQWIGG